MVLIDTLAPALLVLALLWIQRRMESWLHQHLFKVGWLVTKDLRTTTLVYYLIFLPGVVLHELVLWLTAGILNVRADRAIAWPEAQSVAELKLNFVKVAKTASSLKLAVIHTMPLIVGVALIYTIANNVLRVGVYLGAVQGGALTIDAALTLLLTAPDFFLWLYLIFTIGATMWPDIKQLKGWRIVGIVLVVIIIGLYALGIGDTVLANGLATPIANGINILSLAIGVIIATHALLTAVLGTLEAIIERVTGDSATFQNGKLNAIKREDRLKQEAEQRAKQEKQRAQETERAANRKAMGGAPSIYRLSLPMPGGPGKENVILDGVLVSKDNRALPGASLPTDGRAGASVITGTAVMITSEAAPPPADGPDSPSPAAPE